ncbi:hypothetical protein ACFSKU_06180 [Pontibacter silvestris]|uniref:Secreted protein n=1 Tax=Pontibacter silvestris TaxID=2305183 RepID=A0ABW4WUM7_9BACT|nr:hypothetical protein [Pontibacter silvestris]MCC9136422.1 hypothetical protein [Pontibacter silvestris]
MKRTFLLMLTLAFCSFASCNSSTEERGGESEEELRDEAKRKAAEMEDAAEETDTTAVVEKP